MQQLPRIKNQVNVCTTLLGKAIAHFHGKDALTLTEKLHQLADETRTMGEEKSVKQLFHILDNIEALSPKQILLVAKAFSIYLVLVNACENAYRTSRLRQTIGQESPPLKGCLIYVLTAHPTEIRSAASISIIHRITGILTGWFSRGTDKLPLPDEEKELSALIRLLWHLGIHKASPVTPEEEIDHIAGQFNDEILTEILSLRRRGADLWFRTWVGGDKDGHPGINASTLHISLKRTRQRFYQFLKKRLDAIKEDLKQLGDGIAFQIKLVEKSLQDVKYVTSGDGFRINTLRQNLSSLIKKVKIILGELPLNLIEIQDLLNLFPGLVLPVELREESSIFLDLQRKKALGTIGKMLRKAYGISDGGELSHYIQGLIISMTRSTEDYEAALDVVKRTVGTGKIPIIPLFERGEDLENAPETIDLVLGKYLPSLYKDPDKPLKFEIMVGYSDTAKRMGAFASRRSIFHSMHQLAKVCKKYKLEPIFFHGAGGSVTRGGGSIEEQFAAWPLEARKVIKLTVQGEMVDRTLATPEILRRNVERLLDTAQSLTSKTSTLKRTILDELASLSAQAFKNLISDKRFHKFMVQATPYSNLDLLYLGSRPSHRPDKNINADIRSLRAIPWVLCFTQVRLLVPSWYGVGMAFTQLCQDPEKLEAVKNAFNNDMAFRGFIKLMGFSLAKGDRSVFTFFADALAKEPELNDIKEELLNEEKRVTEMVTILSGHNDYLWFRPWLSQSILFRGSSIHPLSVIELSALKNKNQKKAKPFNDELLRMSIAGTAVGMLTTG